MKIKQIGQAIPQWLIDGAEKAGNKVADIKEKAPVLVNGIKNAYQKGLNKPKQMDLFEENNND
mgnify:CR=1 FL=1|jgi:hypothetical protein